MTVLYTHTHTQIQNVAVKNVKKRQKTSTTPLAFALKGWGVFMSVSEVMSGFHQLIHVGRQAVS